MTTTKQVKWKQKKGFFTIKEANSQTSVYLPTTGQQAKNLLTATNEQYSTDPFSKLTTACQTDTTINEFRNQIPRNCRPQRVVITQSSWRDLTMICRSVMDSRGSNNRYVSKNNCDLRGLIVAKHLRLKTTNFLDSKLLTFSTEQAILSSFTKRLKPNHVVTTINLWKPLNKHSNKMMEKFISVESEVPLIWLWQYLVPFLKLNSWNY